MLKCCLKAVLKERNMTQKELCDAINARPSTICNLCNNSAESIKLALAEDICRALDCCISDIFIIV